MNGLKARLISLKNRVQGHLRRKCKNARHGSSTMRKLFTIHRLRMKISKLSIVYTCITKNTWFLKLITAAIDCDYRRTLLLIAGNRRSQYSSGGKQEVKLVSSATQTEEVDVPSEVVTPLPTNFASESATPVALPSTLLPTFTPQSECLSVTQRSPSLNSWGSWLSVASALSKEERGISLRRCVTDDNQGAEYKDKQESSGIAANYTASEAEDNNVDDNGSDFDSDSDDVDVPSEAVTSLPTNSSESATPVALPSTDLPPLSGCPRPPVMLWSPSLNSWDSCPSIVSTQSKEKLNSWDSCSSIASTQSEKKLNSWDSCSSVASTLSKEKLNSWDSCSSTASTQSREEHGISHQTSDDEDDKQGVEYKDEEECAAIPSAGGNSVCSNDKLFPNTSSGIVADYTASEGDSNVDDDGSDFDSESDFDGNSSTSGSISDGEIQIIACDDAMEQSADEDLEIQSLYRPVTRSSSSFGSKPELTLLTLPPKMIQAHPILTDLLPVLPLRQRQNESGKIVLPTTMPFKKAL